MLLQMIVVSSGSCVRWHNW